MSYQTKSTPYLQRMLTRSKQNNELQMLKEEYERMNVCDERNIDMKLREARLKVLFKKIEHIRKCNFERSHRLYPTEKPKAKEAKRLENLKIAKKLGQYFSQRNFREAEAKRKDPQSRRKKFILDDELLESPALNEILDLNTNTIHNKNICKEFARGVSTKLNSYINSKTNSKRTFRIDRNMKLVQSIHDNPNISKNSKKFNTTSTIQDNFVNTNDCISLQIDRNSEAKSSVLTLSENVHLIDLETCDNKPEAIYIDKASFKVMLSCNPSKHVHLTRAGKNWQKLATFIRIHFGVHRPSKVCDQTNNKATNVDELNNQRIKSNKDLFQARTIKSLNLDSTPLLSQNSEFLNSISMSPEDEDYNNRFVEKNDASKLTVGKLRRLFEY